MSHLTNLQSRMKAGEVEAVLVSSEINQRYLTGLNYTDGYVLVLPEAAYLLADFRYIEVARATAGSAGIEVVMPEGGMLPCVAGLLEKHAVRHLAYEEETVSCALRIRFAETFPGVELMTGASRLLDSLRLVKDADEIAFMTQAQKRLGLLYNSFYFVTHTHSPNCGPKTGFKTCSPRCLADSAGCD